MKVVQERLGHGSAMETLDTYAHLFEGDEDGTGRAIDALFANADEASRVPFVSRGGLSEASGG